MAEDLTDVFIWYSQNLEQVPAELQANVTKLLSVGLSELNSSVKLSDLISSEDLKTVTELAPTSQRDLRKLLATQVRADDKLKRVNLRKMTIPELRTLAKEHDVTVPSNLTKREIINILMKSDTRADKHADKFSNMQSGGGLVDGNVKLLALIKLDELAVRHQLIEPGRQLPGHCQQAVRDNFERAEHEAQQILTNQSGGAVSPVVIGAIALGSLTLVAIVIYIYRRLRGRTTAQPIPMASASTPTVTPRSDVSTQQSTPRFNPHRDLPKSVAWSPDDTLASIKTKLTKWPWIAYAHWPDELAKTQFQKNMGVDWIGDEPMLVISYTRSEDDLTHRHKLIFPPRPDLRRDGYYIYLDTQTPYISNTLSDLLTDRNLISRPKPPPGVIEEPPYRESPISLSRVVYSRLPDVKEPRPSPFPPELNFSYPQNPKLKI